MSKTDSRVTCSLGWPSESSHVPRSAYLDVDLFDIEMAEVFQGPSWILLAHESELPLPGDFKAARLGSVPVIVVRASDGGIRVLVNACAHRGARVVHEDVGNVGPSLHLRCIYHAWTYDLDGRLLSASLEEDFPSDFARSDYGLPKARVEVHSGMIFASLSDETPSLSEYLGGIQEGLERSLGPGELMFLGSQKVVFECNWKIYAENIYDGYHTVALHKAFRMLQMKAAGGTISAPDYERSGHVWNEYTTLPVENRDLLKDGSLLESRTKPDNANRIINIFPVGILSDQLDTLSLRFVTPLSVDRTQVDFAVFAKSGETSDIVAHRVAQGSNLFGPEGFISLEDATALSRVQMSASSGGDSIVLKGTPKAAPPYRIVDEAAIRHFYGAYRRLLGL